MTRQKARCRGTKKDGTPCNATALPGSEFCLFHDPARADEMQVARMKGGLRGLIRTLPPDWPDAKIDSCGSILDLIRDTISQVRRGEIDPKIANSVGYLANVAIRALESGDLEERIKALEECVHKQLGATARP